MRSILVPFMAAVLIGDSGLAQSAPIKPAHDIWETVFTRDRDGRDQQIGYAHLLVEPFEVDGQKRLRGARELHLTIKRDGQTAELKATTGTEETEDGKVVAVTMKQWLGARQMVTMRGTVDEAAKKIKISIEANVKKNEFENPWDANVLGLSREAVLFRDKKIKPGDSFQYAIFEPTINHVATIHVVVKDIEEVLLPRGGRKKLLRVESTPEKIQDVQLPASTIWADPESFEPVMTQIDMPQIGLLTLLRSNQASATGPLGEAPDLMKLQTIRLRQRISGGADGLHSITFKVSFSGDVDPAKLIRADARQKISPADGKSFELVVEARRAPVAISKVVEADEEFVKSNFYINSDDQNVKKLAAQAVGKRTDPWEKAKAIERWVRANMKSVNYSEAMATADHVAQTLSGDCSEYSMLAAAMCKAQGIPARVAIGLIYVDREAFGGPALAFHMWTEVYVQGQWLGLDATLGQGSIGPGHIKITDHSWHDVLDFKPLLPVTGFIMAKPVFEVLKATKE